MAQYENLEVWKLSHEFVLDVYKVIEKFPTAERYRLTDQLCRAACSIPMNICEGSGRNTDKDFAHFLYISRGSLYETKYQLLLSRDLGYIDHEDYNTLLKKSDSIGKLLNALIKKLAASY